MHSIRSHLALGLLTGFVLLLSVASFLIYLISKQMIKTDFDARLLTKAQAVSASITQKGTRFEMDWNNLPEGLAAHGNPISMIELLDESGNFLSGDSSLKYGGLPHLNGYKYNNMDAPNGERIRVVSLAFQPEVEDEDAAITPPAIRKNCIVVVGGNRTQLDHSLDQLASVLIAMTIVASILSLGVVFLVLHRGLRPLARLSLEVAKIDATSLKNRLDFESLPTELLPIVEKLNDLLNRLEVTFRRERRFSADVSHELRTPIAELRSLSEIMLRQPNLTAETRHAFQDVLDVSCQMQGLVSALLEIVRGERNLSTLEINPVDLGELLRAAWKPYENKAQTKHLQVTMNIPAHLWVKTDPRLLRLVFNNLFSNAVNYTPENGSMEMDLKDFGDRLVVSIQNSSHDVNPEDLAHFFERFWRKDKVRGNTENMGLGLSITQIFCQRLQIHLTVSTPKPDVVCFWLNVPLSIIATDEGAGPTTVVQVRTDFPRNLTPAKSL